MNASEVAREAAALHLWDEGIVRPESAAFAVVDFLVRESHVTLSTPPADDVREALARVMHEMRHPCGEPPVDFDYERADLVLAAFEVRPHGKVTEAEPAGLCSQCGEPFGEHSCVPIPSCIHVESILAEARPHGTVTEDEVEAAAQAIYEDLGGEWPWSSLTSSFQESYLSNARAALEAAREVHP